MTLNAAAAGWGKADSAHSVRIVHEGERQTGPTPSACNSTPPRYHRSSATGPCGSAAL